MKDYEITEVRNIISTMLRDCQNDDDIVYDLFNLVDGILDSVRRKRKILAYFDNLIAVNDPKHFDKIVDSQKQLTSINDSAVMSSQNIEKTRVEILDSFNKFRTNNDKIGQILDVQPKTAE